MMTADPEVGLSNKPSSRLVSSDKERAGEDISGFLELFALGSPQISGIPVRFSDSLRGASNKKIGGSSQGPDSK